MPDSLRVGMACFPFMAMEVEVNIVKYPGDVKKDHIHSLAVIHQRSGLVLEHWMIKPTRSLQHDALLWSVELTRVCDNYGLTP